MHVGVDDLDLIIGEIRGIMELVKDGREERLIVGEKRTYVTPRLTVYGSIQDITQQANGKEPGSGDATLNSPPGKKNQGCEDGMHGRS